MTTRRKAKHLTRPTLRDYLATSATPQDIKRHQLSGPKPLTVEQAKYSYAKAMLAARGAKL